MLLSAFRRKPPRRPTRSGRGFTLIELLVVVSIIAVLIGILLPTLGAARDGAEGIVCASNVRQLHLANASYAVNNGRYVAAAADIGGANLHRWHGVRPTTNDPFDPTQGPLWSYFEVERLKRCPTFEHFFESGGQSGAFDMGTGGYGYNDRYVGKRDPENPHAADSLARGARPSDFDTPTETVMFADAAYSVPESGEPRLIEYSFAEAPFFTGSYTGSYTGAASPSTHFRHGGSANVLWLDGHVSGRALSFSGSTLSYAGFVSEADNVAQNIGFFGPQDNSLFDRE